MSPSVRFVVGGEEGYGIGGDLKALSEAMDQAGSLIFCRAEGLLCFAKYDYRRAAIAGSDSEAGGKLNLFSRQLKWLRKHIYTQPLGQHRCVEVIAARQDEQKLVVFKLAQEVVAPQEASCSLGNLAQHLIATPDLDVRIAVFAGIDAEEDEAKCSLHALHTVGFAKEDRQQRWPIVHAGNRDPLSVGFGRLEQFFEWGRRKLRCIVSVHPVTP